MLWDLDPQGGGGFLLGWTGGWARMRFRVFAKEASPESLVVRTRFDRLDVLPADQGLHGLDRLFAGLGKKRRLAKLARVA